MYYEADKAQQNVLSNNLLNKYADLYSSLVYAAGV